MFVLSCHESFTCLRRSSAHSSLQNYLNFQLFSSMSSLFTAMLCLLFSCDIITIFSFPALLSSLSVSCPALFPLKRLHLALRVSPLNQIWWWMFGVHRVSCATQSLGFASWNDPTASFYTNWHFYKWIITLIRSTAFSHTAASLWWTLAAENRAHCDLIWAR